MTRWLLNTFPGWALAVIVVGGLVAFAVVGQYLTRRRWPRTAEGEHNDAAGVVLGLVGVVYGIVLAFVIVALYEDHQDAKSVVQREASEIEQLRRGSAVFPDDVGQEIRRELDDYVRGVITTEWERMEEGGFSRDAWRRVDALYATYQGYNPQTRNESAFYGEAVAKLDDLVAARRERLHLAEETLPGAFQALIFGGALLLVGLLWFIGTRSLRVEVTMVVGLAALVGVNLLLVMLLDHPFSGDVGVESHPFVERALES
jgi:Protein of unknown function (DUF4239)